MEPHLPQFEANQRVRLKSAPTRQGVTTGRTREGRGGHGFRYQVVFADATSWIPDDQLELLPAQQESPIDLLQDRKLGGPVDFRRTLTHIRLTGRLADVIYSMEATDTDFYAYQFKPVLRFLMSPTNSLLIADEVGLGKTIEAGLIWTELKSRSDAKRLLIMCPAILREKWQRELIDKIGVAATIVTVSELFDTLQDPMSSMRGYAMICSLQAARPHRDWMESDTPNAAAKLARFLQSRENEEPLIDLLVVDEAHYLRNPESQSNEFAHLIRTVSENVVLLSATPIHNFNQDLFSLLRILDSDTFRHPADFSSILDACKPLVEARDTILNAKRDHGAIQSLLNLAKTHPILRDNRQLAQVQQQLAENEWVHSREQRAQIARQLETVNPLAYLITRTRKRDIKEWRVIREPVRERVKMTDREAACYESVTQLVSRYALRMKGHDQFVLNTPQRQLASSMAATLKAWQRRQDNTDDSLFGENDGEQEQQLGPLAFELTSRAFEFGDPDALMADDSKYKRLREVLASHFAKYADEKVVLFSTFRATLDYLSSRLRSDGIANIVLHGGVATPKDEVLQQFRDDSSIRVLLSSEVGSEGVDLQFCRVLVNYDLPWNPMRVEQRIGRLDRLGQRAHKITIWNIFSDDTIDSRIYLRLYEKLDLCRRALGDFEAILGDEVRKLSAALLSTHLSPEQQEARIDQTAQALANLEHDQHKLESESSHLVAYGDYILKEIHAARELNRWIDGQDLKSYVTDYLSVNFPGCLIREPARGDSVEIQLSDSAKYELEEFIRQNRMPTTQLTRNVARPIECRFESRVTTPRAGSIEIVSQFHPLVRFISHTINTSDYQLRPAVAVRLAKKDCDSGIAPGVYVLAVSRWSIDGLRSVEKLAFAATKLERPFAELNAVEAERLASLCARHGGEWLEARSHVDFSLAVAAADEFLFGSLEQRFEEFAEDLRRQNEDRADLQLNNLERHFAAQSEQLLATRERHEMLGRDSLAKATVGRVQALEARVSQQRLKIEGRRSTTQRNDEMLVALVNVV